MYYAANTATNNWHMDTPKRPMTILNDPLIVVGKSYARAFKLKITMAGLQISVGFFHMISMCSNNLSFSPVLSLIGFRFCLQLIMKHPATRLGKFLQHSSLRMNQSHQKVSLQKRYTPILSQGNPISVERT